MGGTKGSHIVLDHPELLAAATAGEIFFEHNDGRIVLIYPLAGRVLVGTTDLEHDMARTPSAPRTEIDYFFDLVEHVFPDITVDRSQIVFRFSGVRPLPRHDASRPASSPATTASSPARSRRAAGRRHRCSAWSAASGPPSAPSPST